jgi:hypothetical protein
LANILRALAMSQRISTAVLAETFAGYLLVGLAFAQFYGTLDGLAADGLAMGPR